CPRSIPRRSRPAPTAGARPARAAPRAAFASTYGAWPVGLAVPCVGAHTQGGALADVERMAGHVHTCGAGVQGEEVGQRVAAAIGTGITDGEVQVEVGRGGVAAVHGRRRIVQGAIPVEGHGLVSGVVALEGEPGADGDLHGGHMVVVHVDLALVAAAAVAVDAPVVAGVLGADGVVHHLPHRAVLGVGEVDAVARARAARAAADAVVGDDVGHALCGAALHFDADPAVLDPVVADVVSLRASNDQDAFPRATGGRRAQHVADHRTGVALELGGGGRHADAFRASGGGDLVAHHIAGVHPHMAVLEQVPHDLTADGIRGELYVAVHKVAIEHPHQGAPHGARAGEHDRAAGIAHALDGHLPVGGGHHRPVALHHEVSVVHVV